MPGKAIGSVRPLLHILYAVLILVLLVVGTYLSILGWWLPVVSAVLTAVCITFLYLSLTAPDAERGEAFFTASVVSGALNLVSFVATVIWSVTRAF